MVIFSTTLPRLLARNRRHLKAHHSQPCSALYNSFLNHLLRPEYARTSLNGFCADGLGHRSTAHPQDSFLLLLRIPTKTGDLFSISRTRRIWQLRSQKGRERLNQVYTLALAAFRAKVRGAKYREANDPEPEIWHSCQRGPSLQWMGGFLLLSDFRRPQRSILLIRFAKF